MAFNGSGVFSRLYSWANDATADLDISSSRMDNEMNGMATGLSTCITKDGQTTTTASIPFASGINADTISEKTSAAGVTIDGLLVKDYNITLSDNTTPTKKATFDLSGITASNTRTITLPDADFTAVGLALAQTLTNKTIATGSGNDVQQQFNIINTTYDLSTASGNKDITGFGFDPRGCIIMSGVGASNAKVSLGWGNGSTSAAMYTNATSGTWSAATGLAFVMQDSIGVTQVTGSASMITDGIRLAMTKTGSPTGTVIISVLAWR